MILVGVALAAAAANQTSSSPNLVGRAERKCCLPGQVFRPSAGPFN